MNQTGAILKIFISSPSDVTSEKLAVVEAIEETNRTWADFLGIRLEPVLFETHCRPGVGNDAQQVINGQLPVEAWINEFIALILTKSATSDLVNSYLERVAGLSGKFREQSVRYAHFLDVPEDVLKEYPEDAKAIVEIFQELELKQGELFQVISKDLASAVDILNEAASVIELLVRRTTSDKKH